jgi:hypothetical protein
MENIKKRTINEIRQVKDTNYIPPLSYDAAKKEKNVEIDPTHVEELIKNFPNDYDLGHELRTYYLKLCGKL